MYETLVVGERQEKGDRLSRQSGLGGGDYGSFTCCKGPAHFLFPNWAALEKKKKKTFVILLYLKLPWIQLRKWTFMGCRMTILAVGLSANSEREYGLHRGMV